MESDIYDMPALRKTPPRYPLAAAGKPRWRHLSPLAAVFAAAGDGNIRRRCRQVLSSSSCRLWATLVWTVPAW